MKYQIEVTDTFQGETNYSWVRRHILEVDEKTSDLALVRRAKALEGWNGLPCRKSDYGDMIELRPSGICQVMFISWISE